MTLREDQLLQVQGSQKGRSASFCAGAEGEAPPGAPAGWGAPPARDLAAAARRSQSCRVQGARPRVRRREKKGEALDLADASSTGCLAQGEPSYHPFLHKAPSCGKVFYQTVDGPVMQTYTPESSPGVARRARRPPLPSVSTPEDSPSLARRPIRTRALAGGAQGRGSPSSRYKQRALEPDPEDPDAYRLRNFSLTAKGIVNRGDSFRVRRPSVQCGVLMPGAAPAPAAPAAAAPPPPPSPVSSFSVALVGATGVGKTALIDQFMTSECTNAYDRERTQDGASDEQTVCIELDGEESELRFLNITNPKVEITTVEPPDALAIVYSVIDKSSFERAEDELSRLQVLDLLRNRCLVLVGNKIDVVRSRAVNESDGMELACSYNAKFIEISVGMNHNCDELLVGMLHQLRLKRDSYEPQKEHNWSRNKGIVRASRKVKRTLTKIFGKEDARLRNVTNFRVHN